MIRPVSFSANPMNFKGYTILGHDNEPVYSKEEDRNNNNKEYYVDSHTRKQDIKNSLCVGALAGAILAGASVSIYKDHQIKDLINDISEEMSYESFDSLKIEDSTKDSIPDIVLVDSLGNETVYDLTSGSVYYKEGNEFIEKMR